MPSSVVAANHAWPLSVAILLGWLLMPSPVPAEPYFAIDKGLHCSTCHTHAAGGGKRTTYGNVFAQTELPANAADGESGFWTGEVNRWLSVGADLRGGFTYANEDQTDDRNEFDISRGTVYIEAKPFGEILSLYLDQQVAPSSSINREAYLLLRGSKFRLTAGQFYLPYGLRLQDDTAFVRRVTGVSISPIPIAAYKSVMRAAIGRTLCQSRTVAAALLKLTMENKSARWRVM